MSINRKLSDLMEEGHKQFPLNGRGAYIRINPETGEVLACALGKAVLATGLAPAEAAVLSTQEVETRILEATTVDIDRKRVRMPKETRGWWNEKKLPILSSVIFELNDGYEWDTPQIAAFLKSKGL